MKQCHHCGFVIPTGKAKIEKCPKCNYPLPAASIPERPALESPANAWLEMRRKAGFAERVQQKPRDGTKQ